MKDIYFKICNLIVKTPKQTKYKYIKKYEKEFSDEGYCFEGILDYLIDEKVLTENKVIKDEYIFNVIQLDINRFLEFFELSFDKKDYIEILDYFIKHPNKSKNTYIKEITNLYNLDKDTVLNKIDYLIYENVLNYKKQSYRGNYYTSLSTSLLDIYDFFN